MSDSSPAPLKLTFDPRIYSTAVVKKAAYRFGSRCHIQIEIGNDGEIVVTLKPTSLRENLELLAGEFENEVLDQDLREIVAKETEGLRNLILAQAFSQTSLLDPVGDEADFHDDPLHIRLSDRQNRAPAESDS